MSFPTIFITKSDRRERRDREPRFGIVSFPGVLFSIPEVAHALAERGRPDGQAPEAPPQIHEAWTRLEIRSKYEDGIPKNIFARTDTYFAKTFSRKMQISF